MDACALFCFTLVFLYMMTLSVNGDPSLSSTSPYVQQFDVKPGGVQHDFSMERDGITCKFTYICQGGTNEKWRMLITQIHEVGTYGCVVERESGTSYLFFQSFTLSASGQAECHQAHAFGNGGRDLKMDEFKFEKPQCRVKDTGKFGAELARLAIEFSRTVKGDEL